MTERACGLNVPESFHGEVQIAFHNCEPVTTFRSHLHADVAENLGVVAEKDAEVLSVLVLQIEHMAGWSSRSLCTRRTIPLSHWYSILQNGSMALWL